PATPDDRPAPSGPAGPDFLRHDPMDAWPRCLQRLEAELPAEAVHTWPKPLQASRQDTRTVLYAPNACVRDDVQSRYMPRIRELLGRRPRWPPPRRSTRRRWRPSPATSTRTTPSTTSSRAAATSSDAPPPGRPRSSPVTAPTTRCCCTAAPAWARPT